MKILHDYDSGGLSGSWALRRGISLIVYAIKRGLGLAPRGYETDRYMETLIKLDKLCGVESIIGIRDTVSRVEPGLFAVAEGYGADVRNHIHIGANDDPNKRRLWEPPLEGMGIHAYHYEDAWITGDPVKLGSAELPVWHVDYPYRFGDYVDFLYACKFGGFNPYKEDK